ncbi:succinate--CoA ligase subunit alpha [Candidatus Saccharibacteria bacterium]|nr:succinate--CoA ligase subunit alpha [Candidatus Saccharibacteria bacterium]
MPSTFNPQHVIVQGITGSHGSFHARAMREYGTRIIAGTSPNKAGEMVDGIPVYSTIRDIQANHEVDATVIFVPAAHARGAIFEAIEASVPLIICITEGIPTHDMLAVHQRLAGSESILIGPNSPGIATPGESKLGIIPNHILSPGRIGVVSRSGTLTYEVVAALSSAGIGERYVVGIGGDPIKGMDFVDCLAAFEADTSVDAIVMIGEIGGQSENRAADYIKKSVAKPVVGYIAGHAAPPGVQLGHAGAILGSKQESAVYKSERLSEAGVTICKTVTDITPQIQKISRSTQ